MIYIKEGEAPYTIRIQKTMFRDGMEIDALRLELVNTTTRERVVKPTELLDYHAFYELVLNYNLTPGEWEYKLNLWSDDNQYVETGLLVCLGDNEKIIEYNG